MRLPWQLFALESGREGEGEEAEGKGGNCWGRRWRGNSPLKREEWFICPPPGQVKGGGCCRMEAGLGGMPCLSDFLRPESTQKAGFGFQFSFQLAV